MRTFPYVLSCDWFSYTCYVPFAFRSVSPANENKLAKLYRVYKYHSFEFEVVASKEFHPCFSMSCSLRWNDVEVCSLFFGDKRNPKSLAGIAKVANSFLYYGDWARVFLGALSAVGWRRVSVKRVDVCADFELFLNGRKPLQFIHDYLSAPTASTPSFIRKSSNKYVATGVRAVAANIVQSVRWGTRESPVQVNLYNKTQELADVKMKPWIVEKWRQNGLQTGIDEHGRTHWVWRVEFSIDCQQLALRMRNKSKVWDVSLNDVADQASLANLFAVLVPSYFQFYTLTLDDVRRHAKVRDLQPIELFDIVNLPKNVTTMTLSRKIGSGRTERLLANRLGELVASGAISKDKRDAALQVQSQLLALSACKDSVDESAAEDVLADFIYGLTAPQDIKLSRMSRAIASHHAHRFARLLRCGNSNEFADYAWACEALQLDLEGLRSKIHDVLTQAPDDAYECWMDEDIDLDYIQQLDASRQTQTQNDLPSFSPEAAPIIPGHLLDDTFGM